MGHAFSNIFLGNSALLMNRSTQDRTLNVQYEWTANQSDALQAGLSPAAIAAVAVGNRPQLVEQVEEIVYNFTEELIYCLGENVPA